jgi:SpoVK/Ycf46/Vps4 family AAA+-type ATPase
LKTDNILCFEKSVSVHRIQSSTSSTQQQEGGSKLPPLRLQNVVTHPSHPGVTTVYAVEESKTVEGLDCSNQQHSHFILRQPYQEEASSSSLFRRDAVVALSGSPSPLLSLVIKATGGDGNDDVQSSLPMTSPLQQASWKRQLVGSMILFQEKKYTTTIQLLMAGDDSQQKRVSLSVESVSARSPPGQTLFVVLPSTRISLVEDDSYRETTVKHTTLSLTTPTPSSSAISPVTQLLLHTALCMNHNIPVPRTFLLSGPPGVGKTYSVKQVLDLCPFPVQLVSLRGSEVLQTTTNAAQSLAREFEKAANRHKKQNPNQNSTSSLSIIFLDECDALVSDNTMAAMLATLLDKVANIWSQLMVVGATNRIDSIPGYLRRAGRFDKEIPMTPPNAKERASILSSLLLLMRQQQQSTSKAEGATDEEHSLWMEETRNEIQRIAELCVGYVPADLNALVRKATLLAAQEETGTNAERPSVIHQLEAAMLDVGPSALRDASLCSPPKISWDDIAGDPGGAKTALRQAIEWPRTKAKSFARLGLIPPRGILLHGPPGCAKTTLARAAAGASGVAFLSLSPAEVYSSSYVGEAEAVVRRAFSLARSAAPCVLFFDEMDSIFGGLQDGGRGNSAEARVLSTFLNEMDGVDNNRGADGVLVLGATNRPWTLDSALLRPGRLGDKIIYIPPPDAPSRRAIFEMQFREQGHAMDLDWLASDAVTGLMTGAELVGACQEAKLGMLRDMITPPDPEHNTPNIQEYLVDALKSKKPLLSDPEALKEFRIFEQHSGSS